MGSIRLKAQGLGGSTTVTLTGVAKFTDDGSTYKVAANATVTVGTLSAKTNANGEYTITGIQPGTTTVKATYLTYRAVEATFSAQAGYVVRFDPSFVRAGSQSTLYVIVNDQVSGQPISNATVNLNNVIQTTNAKGESTFNSGVEAGSNTVSVTANGYGSRIISVDVNGVQNITLPVTLVPVTPGQTSLSGIITDANTGLTLQGAIVRLGAHSATSDASGKYSISGPPDFSGKNSISIEKSGYQTHTQDIDIKSGLPHSFDVPLQVTPNNSAKTQIRFVVRDALTSQPVMGSKVTLSGVNAYSSNTDSNGEVMFDNLSAGATQVQVAAAGYDDALFSIDLQKGISYQVPVELNAQSVGPNRIYGQIIDAVSRRPIANAKVSLYGSTVMQTTSDANGRYEFTGVNPGRWHLAANATAYAGYGKSYNISSTSEVNIALRLGGNFTSSGTLRTIAVGHPNNSSAAIGYLFIFGSQGTAGSVVSNDGMETEFLIDSSGVAEVVVPSSQFLNTSGKPLEKAMLVYANNPVSAYFLNRQQFTTDMTYLLDVAALGKNYKILNWQYSLQSIQMSFTAMEDGTTVRVTPSTVLQPAVGTAGSPFEVQINKGQSYIYTSSSGRDMTGTSITSDKPIAVFAGAQCTNIPSSAGYCDHIFTQLPPVEYWAKEYVIPKTSNTGSAGNLVRILSASDGNEVFIDGVSVKKLDSNQFHEIEVAGDMLVTASKPVLVGQFLKGSTATTGGRLGDPAFTYLPGISQGLSAYVFNAPLNLVAYQENYVNVAIISSSVSSLKLNGAAVDVSQFRTLGSYSLGNIKVASGPGEISANTPFIATLTGFNQDDSYHTLIGANYSSGASVVDPIIANISVSVDKPTYPANTDVLLSGQAENKGITAADLTITLQIVDDAGNIVERFTEYPLGVLQPGQTGTHQNHWNSGSYQAGTYKLIGYLRDKDANIIDVSSTIFNIAAGGSLNSAVGALAISTDRGVYRPDDRVLIANIARNIAPNAVIEDARVDFSVKDPNGVVVFTHSEVLGQINANGLKSFNTPQILRGAALGEYTIVADLFGSGNIKSTSTRKKAYVVNEKIATATAIYRVENYDDPNPGGGLNPGADADYAVTKTAVTPNISVNGQAVWEITVTNKGPQDGLGVIVEDLAPSNLSNVQWACTSMGRAACGARNGVGDIKTDALVHAGAGNSVTFRVTGDAQIAGELVNAVSVTPANGATDPDGSNNRSSARVRVTGGSSGTAVKPVPVDSPWALLALALAAAFCGAARARRQMN